MRRILGLALAASVSLGALMAPQKAEAVISPADKNNPVVIFLDGINPKSLAVYTTLQDYSQLRTQPYLIYDLGKTRWGYNPPKDTNAQTILWNGDLSNNAGLDAYTAQAMDLIAATVKANPTRPIVVVAHSWGGVVAFNALRNLAFRSESGRRSVDSGAVTLFVTLGSPLAGWEGTTTDQKVLQLIDTKPFTTGWCDVGGECPVSKPDTVGSWVSFSVPDDLIANSKTQDVDERIKLSNLANTKFPATALEYFTNTTNASLEKQVAERVLNNDCKNLNTWNAGAAPAGYGIAYEGDSDRHNLEIRVACHGAYTQPTTTAERSVGAKLEVETWAKQQAYVWKNNAWQSLMLNGTPNGSTGIITNKTTTDLPLTSSDLASGKRNYVAVQTCSGWINQDVFHGTCGCKDTACTQQGLWQIQTFLR